MKQFLYPVLASALVAVAATSCSSDAPVAPEQTPDGTVAFTVTVPQQIASRAFSDGLSATQLHYYVYDEDESSANIAALNGTARGVFGVEKEAQAERKNMNLKEALCCAI